MANFLANFARGSARDLPEPATWTDPVARAVYDYIINEAWLVDLYLVEAYPRPDCHAWPATPVGHVHGPNCRVCAQLASAYGNRPHVIDYRMWDEPGPREDAQDYITRHLGAARQMLGGVPWISGRAIREATL